MLAHVHGKLSAQTPGIVAEGDLEGWGYVVMTRLEGRQANTTLKSAGAPEGRAILRAIGALLAEIHALPAPPTLDADWASFVTREAATCVKRHAAGGAAPAWLEAIPARIAGLPSPERVAPLHADVHGDHVLLDDELHVTGLLDFGDAMVGDPA